VCWHLTQLRKRKFEEMVSDYEKLLAMGATASSTGRKKEEITMVELTWRIKMLRQHGPKARGMWTLAWWLIEIFRGR
jgi:hypothetical protein